jgi:putative heme-binding domain-containing protein
MSERRTPADLEAFRRILDESSATSVEGLWGLAAAEAFDDDVARDALDHAFPEVRTWGVRLLGDRRALTPESGRRLLALAAREKSLRVRAQLAASAKRLPAELAVPLLRELVGREENAKDPYIPLLVWWALEDKAVVARDLVLDRLFQGEAWAAPLTRGTLLERIGRRYLAEGDAETCARLLAAAPDGEARRLLIAGLEKALEGRALPEVPPALQAFLASMLGDRNRDAQGLALGVRLGSPEAYQETLRVLRGTPSAQDLALLLPLLGQLARPDSLPALLALLPKAPDAVIGALGPFQDPGVARALLANWTSLKGPARNRALGLLSGRLPFAVQLLDAVDAGIVSAAELPLHDLQRMAALGDEALGARLAKRWGKVGASTDGEKQARISSIRNILSSGAGDARRGRLHFQKLCAACHTLWGEGGKVGPELTGAERKDLSVLLPAIVDPSGMIRPEYHAQQILTTDGSVLLGLLAEESPDAVTILDAQAARTVLPRSRIERMRPAALSLMPEKLLDPLSDPEIRDFFAYLRGTEPPAPGPSPDGPLPGTGLLDDAGDLSMEMIAGIDRFLLREIEAAPAARAAFWTRDTSSPEAYLKSVEPNRARLRRMIGAEDPRVPFEAPERLALVGRPERLGQGRGFDIFEIRWPVLRGLRAEGLLLMPQEPAPPATVIVLPDADQTPEQLVGLQEGLKRGHQYARHLAESGYRVVVPALLGRSDEFSVSAVGRATNQPHREFAYRPAFILGRTVPGYEAQAVMALVDWIVKDAAGRDPLIGLHGIGEGGLVALLAGALDPRIDAVHVESWFASRQETWREPIYRNLFGLLREFGDAEIASLIYPRGFGAEAGMSLSVPGPPAPRQGRAGAAPGAWTSPDAAATQAELARWKALLSPLPDASIPEALQPARYVETGALQVRALRSSDPRERERRLLSGVLEDTQQLLRQAETKRQGYFWDRISTKSLEEFRATSAPFRSRFVDEVNGRFDRPLLPPNPRSRRVYDEAAYVGYEVRLDVWPDVFAYGILLVPKGIPAGERRPVVVCQHGLEGRPQDLADPRKEVPAYGRYACKLAERGFVVFAPQNPYLGKDLFRTLQRKANLLGKHLFSIIIPQHEQITGWLASLPFVDPSRIGFYGLSYGGKTAMRVPAAVPRYALSICSADFNEWIWKNASLDNPYTYVTTGEYEIFEWDLGSTFNYAEMAALIAPRPFMVERGHGDGVAPDERVFYEFARVKRLYDRLGIGDRAEMEVFDGPHKIHGVGTFEFLHRHLAWPKPGAMK